MYYAALSYPPPCCLLSGSSLHCAAHPLDHHTTLLAAKWGCPSFVLPIQWIIPPLCCVHWMSCPTSVLSAEWVVPPLWYLPGSHHSCVVPAEGLGREAVKDQSEGNMKEQGSKDCFLFPWHKVKKGLSGTIILWSKGVQNITFTPNICTQMDKNKLLGSICYILNKKIFICH